MMENRVIGLRDFWKEETAAKVARVPPGQLAGRHRNKPAQYSRGICVVRYLQNLLNRDLFGPAGLLPPPRKAMSLKRRRFLRERSARAAPLDSYLTNRALASATRCSRPHTSSCCFCCSRRNRETRDFSFCYGR